MPKFIPPQIIVGLVIVVVGHFVIQAIGWGLPRSRSLSEWWDRVFWIYRPDIPREKVRRNRLAYFLVVVVAYLMTIAYNPPR